jgi:hypothetical protein
MTSTLLGCTKVLDNESDLPIQDPTLAYGGVVSWVYRKESMSRIEPPADYGISGIQLPTGEMLEMGRVRSLNYNPNISALRFSFNVTKVVPLGVDRLTGRVSGVQTMEGRAICRAHKFFRHDDTIYIQDADVAIINL